MSKNIALSFLVTGLLIGQIDVASAYQSHEKPFLNLPNEECTVDFRGNKNCLFKNLWADQGQADEFCRFKINLMTLGRRAGSVIRLLDGSWIALLPGKGYHIWAHRDNRHCIINL